MNLVDSSAWLEYLADGPNAKFFSAAIEKTSELIVPVIVVFEVFKRVLQQRDEIAALQAVSLLHRGKVIELSSALALEAARLSYTLKLPMADSFILSTARTYDAVIWTQDVDFEKLPKVKYRKK